MPGKAKSVGIKCAFGPCPSDAVVKGFCKCHYDQNRLGTPLRMTNSKRALAAEQDGMRKCSYCLEEKPHDRFRPVGFKCKDCRNDQLKKPCPDCGEKLVDRRTRRCRRCQRRYQKIHSRSVSGQGYVKLSGYWDHPNAQSRGHIFEHTLVMSQMLGRPLVNGENVHHKNGVRNDNRPKNLELWVSSQPAGQRPEDLVEWAFEILERYGNQQVAS